MTVKSKVEISQNFVAFSEYMNTTGPIQIENCSAGPVLMRPTENYFDAYHAHLHIMRDLKKLKSSEKKIILRIIQDTL